MQLAVYTAQPSTVEAYHLGETPMTILLSPEGSVLKIWRGAYTGGTKASIEAYFHLKLPDA